MTNDSSPIVEDLDDGWADDPEENALDAAWEEEREAAAEAAEEAKLPPLSPGQPPREKKPKKVRPQRPPREVRLERLRAQEAKKAESRSDRQQREAAKRKVKQPREKKPPRTEPSKKEQRRAQAALAAQKAADAPSVATFDGEPDLARDAAAAKRRGGSLQDARLATKHASAGGVPSWLGYAVLALILGGAALYFVLR